MNTYKITYESRFKIREMDVITARWENNECDDIEKGDKIIIDDGEYIVDGVTKFKKSFDIERDNFSLVLNKID